jgi:hypothetical protein
MYAPFVSGLFRGFREMVSSPRKAGFARLAVAALVGRQAE